MKKIAVILFNLGGPSNQAAVQPFLFNLFNDPAIIRLPQPLRYLAARIISSRRAPIARDIYAKMGGGSPILQNTQAQADAILQQLNSYSPDKIYKVYVSMRYWHPFAKQTARNIKSFAPDEIILLPLYPQFSTTTTASSLDDWHHEAKEIDLDVATRTVCCYPQQNGFIQSLAIATHAAYDEVKQRYGEPRILFSAHGLPEKIIKTGDPYQAQCEMTVRALCQQLNIPNLDSVLCFQSRVGPMKWLTPATEDEVRRAGQDKKPLIVVPVAFVSDHSETLVELDIDYRHLAEQSGVPFYKFVPAIGTAPDFIAGLAQMVRTASERKNTCQSDVGARLCPPEFSGCICRTS